MNTLPIILTGDRPTGSLHLGHYVGSLRQRVALQQDHQQYVLIADLQGLTDNGSNPQKIRDNIPQVLADYLAVGIDPALTTICLQSALPALAELTVLYMNIVTVARVERNPTVKNEIAQKGFTRSLPVGFMAYPISQAADITAFKAEMIPVGDDQLPMIEQTNEIVHKMNSLFSSPVLRPCQALLSDTGRLPGIDGSAFHLVIIRAVEHVDPGAAADFNQTFNFQHDQRFTHDGTRHIEPLSDLSFRRQALPGAVRRLNNQIPYHCAHFLVRSLLRSV